MPTNQVDKEMSYPKMGLKAGKEQGLVRRCYEMLVELLVVLT